MKRVLLIAVSLLVFVPFAGAVDVVNYDSSSYKIEVDDGVIHKETIDANSTTYNVCQEGDIKIVGGDSVHASGDQKVIIEDGSLSVKD